MGIAKPLFRTEQPGPGFRLHLHRTKAFKTVAARLVLGADLDNDTAARALVPRVLGRGTKRLPALRDLQIELDGLFGASLSGDARKVGERHLVQFRADWVADRLAGAPVTDRMCALLAESLHEPATNGDGTLRNDVIVQERKMAADEAAAIFDDKARYARRRLLDAMCRGEAYARPAIGRLEEIRALGATEVQRAYEQLVSRAPADLFLVGDLTWRQAERFARRLGLARRRTARLHRTQRRAPKRVRTVREEQDVGQAKLAMGFRTTLGVRHKLQPALVLMNALFGGSPVSKLFKQVREKASLCYAIHSGLERTKGLVLVHAGIEAENYRRVRRLVLKQLDALREGDIAPEEAAMAAGSLVSGLRSLRDSPGAIIDFAVERAVNGLPADLDGLIRDLREVTIRDVARAARTVELDTVFFLSNGKAAAK